MGPDEISAELLKLSNRENDNILRTFHDILSKCGPTGNRDVVIKVIHKTKGGTDCGACGAITVVAQAGKLLLRIVANCISAHLEENKLLLEKQCGFRSQISTYGMMIRRLQGTIDSTTRKVPLYFLDLTKVYDFNDQYFLFAVLARFEKVIRQFHNVMRACVRLDDGK